VIARRTFLAGTGAVLLAAPFAAEAQPAAKVPRVGVLSPGNAPPDDAFPQREAFESGLRNLGWTPGTNIVIEYRYAKGDRDRLLGQARELVGLPVDVLVARSIIAVRAAQEATRTIPIVMSATQDPVREGAVASLGHPGGNITGLALLAEDLMGKRLELLKNAVPKLSRVALLRIAGHPRRPEVDRAARALRLEVKEYPVTGAQDIRPAFAAMKLARMGAILVPADPLIFDARREEIVALAASHALLAIYSFREFPQSGGLMSYAADLGDIHRRSATYVDRILKGAKAADLPVEQPTKFELVINLKTAKALGLTIPQSLLLRADEVIQ
jgi:putative ABC transport system substrate-binding protein